MEQAHVGVHQDLGDLIEIPGQRKRQHPGIAVLHVATQQDRGPEGLLKLSLQVHFQLSERGVVRRGPGGDRFGKGQRVARRRYGQSPRKRGLEEGLEKGRRREACALALRQLERRCGSLEAATSARIGALTLPQLEELALALLDFQGAEDLRSWLQLLEA